MNEFYPDGARASPDYVRIVSQRHWERLKAIINSSKGTILLGGAMDEAERFMEPTVIQVNNIKDSLVADETFGPIITIFPVKDLGKAIRIANDVHRTPLAAFPFGTKQETDQILDNVRSGGASVNDGWIHGTIPTLAFGGIGDSGTGVYRGRASFECFTHRRSVTTTPAWAERVLGVRYPPYNRNLEQYQNMTGLAPNFDREGKVKSGLIRHAVELMHRKKSDDLIASIYMGELLTI